MLLNRYHTKEVNGTPMNYIVFDLEWNQPMESREKPNEKMPFEIIEIGAVKLNQNMEVVSSFSEVIRPSVYKEINHITKRLLHIDMKELKAGDGFVDVIERFLSWCGEDYIFCIWGTLDITELQRNMDYYDMKPIADKPLAYYDVQKLYSIACEDKKTRRSLEYVVDELKLEKDIPFHRAYGDAFYTAKILSTLNNPEVLEKVSFDTYRVPKKKEDEIAIQFSDYFKYISREFGDKSEAIADKRISSMTCYLCHKNIKRKIRWFTANTKHYYGVGYCDVHKHVKFKVRMKKSQTDNIYVVKTSKFISEDEYLDIKNKKEKAKLIKKDRKKKSKAAKTNPLKQD